jgi:hypothetical protein
VRAGIRGTVETGTVKELCWELGSNPAFRVQYGRRGDQWHNVLREAGTTTRQLIGRTTQRPVPHIIMARAGHGTELEIEWPRGKSTVWYTGVLVARDMDRGVAIRYMGPSGASVAWHTQEDLDQRGHVITRLSTLGEYTNEQYQETGPNRARGCLLLTDEDACECAVCRSRMARRAETGLRAWRGRSGGRDNETGGRQRSAGSTRREAEGSTKEDGS